MSKIVGKTITIFNKKGGVGKSTLATNLAVEFARTQCNTVLVDVDVSRTSYKFMKRRADLELKDESLTIATPENNYELDQVVQDMNYLKIIDVGGFGDELAMASVIYADLLIVPLNATPQDKDTTIDFIKTIQKIKSDGFEIDVVFVLNNVNPNTKFETLAKEVSYVTEAGFDLYGKISTYKIFSTAHGGGQSVVEINPNTNASSQIVLFKEEIIRRLRGQRNG